ncbi:hypothetical protein FB567DRAFT_51516 [Paraphoma chrysanthemicola]|uniref:Uncharacterized protein n=1 Tax=Paraphoma chrysanthemicola TaxID=798071 RepID=A0A8K0R750_9PLEO|nr:hypothetical protein FB567DRAFT_51516 [Paraphoma chrysanthemicola]
MFSQKLICKILDQAESSAAHSWEYSTIFNAHIEYHNAPQSIYNDPFPHGRIQESGEDENSGLKYVKQFILTEGDCLCEGNGSSSDPTSLLIPALLLGASSTSSGEIYIPVVQRQLHTILNLTPRFPNNAISHRDAYPSLWADFVYMVPPALAYYSVVKDEDLYLRDAVRQCELYHDVLGTESGCWKHIVNANDLRGYTGHVKTDEGLWSTSNGWVAAGMARVLATIRKSRFVEAMAKEQKSLASMIKGILDGVMVLDADPSGLLRNRLGDETWFGEAAGTALLAASAFRMAVLEPDVFGTRYSDWAMRKWEVVKRCVDEETGIVAPVVNPTKDEQRTPLKGVSPEAQAFVVMLYAARQDWERAKEKMTQRNRQANNVESGHQS